MAISCIIVSWNVRDALESCLSSIHEHAPSLNVTVVDNASSDGSADIAEQHLGHSHVIRNGENRGFAAAVNQGINASHGEVILLLNPDTRIGPQTIETINRSLSQSSRTAIVGVRLRNPDGTVQPSVRRFPSFADQALILLKLHHVFPNASALQRYFLSTFHYDMTSTVDQVMGACFAFRRSLVSKIGMFDEQFFIWFEEVDFCKRAVEHGLSVQYVAGGDVTHVRAASFLQLAPVRKQWWYVRSAMQYFWKHSPRWQWLLLCLITPLSIGLALVVEIAGRLSGKSYIN